MCCFLLRNCPDKFLSIVLNYPLNFSSEFTTIAQQFIKRKTSCTKPNLSRSQGKLNPSGYTFNVPSYGITPRGSTIHLYQNRDIVLSRDCLAFWNPFFICATCVTSNLYYFLFRCWRNGIRGTRLHPNCNEAARKMS